MNALVFHTMGDVDHVHAALGIQGIIESRELPIAILNIDYTYEHRGEALQYGISIEDNGTLKAEAGSVIVACGAKALKLYQTAHKVPKNIGVEKCRGVYRPFGENTFLTSSYDPNKAFPDFVSGFRADAAVAYRVALTGDIEPTLPVPVELVRSVLTFMIELEDHPEDGDMTVSTDTETMGLDPYKKGVEIICISLTCMRPAWDQPRCQVIYTYGLSKKNWDLLADGLNILFNHPLVKVIGANLKYDWAWFARRGVRCATNFIFDTLLGGSMVDENRWNGLNQHAKVYTDFGGYDDVFNGKFDKAHMEEVPVNDTVMYAGGDSQACYYSARKILAKLKEESRNSSGGILKQSPYNFYMNILHPAARAFEVVEQRGMHLDHDAFHKFGAWTEVERLKLEIIMSKMLPQKIKSKYEDWSGFKPQVVVAYLFDYLGLTPKQTTIKTDKPSTAWAHLQSFADDPIAGEFVKGLKELNAIKKLHSTYYAGFLKHLRDDGLFHPTYWLHRAGMGDEGGAVTGRSSVTDPAVQTIPKHTETAKRLRKCFTAPKGYYVAGLDYSQGELRIVACIANEKTMLEVYANNGDLHAVTASQMLGISLAEFMAKKETDPVWFEAARRNGKAGNFGLVYGMSAEGYVQYAWTLFGIELDYMEAVEQRDKFLTTYSGLTGYHSTMTGEVYRKGQVISPLGRVRHLPHIWCDDQYYSGKARRQAINAPIQSTLADMSFWSIARLHQSFPEIWTWGNIHDQNLLYVREDCWEDEIGKAQEIMENLPFEETFGWNPQLKFPADALVGPSLGELYDVGEFDG